MLILIIYEAEYNVVLQYLHIPGPVQGSGDILSSKKI